MKSNFSITEVDLHLLKNCLTFQLDHFDLLEFKNDEIRDCVRSLLYDLRGRVRGFLHEAFEANQVSN